MNSSPYLAGCRQLPDHLARAAAYEPTPGERRQIAKMVARICLEIRQRRKAWEALHGPIDVEEFWCR